MKHIFLNLKRFDVPVELGGVNRLAPVAEWGRAIVAGTQQGLTGYDPAEAEFVDFFPEAHLIPAAAARTADSRVELGCQEGRLSLSVDSDTLIVKGLAVMLADIVTGCTPQEVAQGDISLYQKLGLEVALTSVRRSGFAQLVGWVQRRAGELAQESP